LSKRNIERERGRAAGAIAGPNACRATEMVRRMSSGRRCADLGPIQRRRRKTCAVAVCQRQRVFPRIDILQRTTTKNS
jgi:hypothetical protein